MISLQMSVALDSIQWQTVYPMDYYSNDSLGAWTNNNEAHRPVRPRKPRPVIGSKGEKPVSKGENKKDNSVSKETNLVSEKDNKLTECLCKMSEPELSLANSVSKENGQKMALQSGSDSSKMDVSSCCDKSTQNGCCSISQPNS